MPLPLQAYSAFVDSRQLTTLSRLVTVLGVGSRATSAPTNAVNECRHVKMIDVPLGECERERRRWQPFERLTDTNDSTGSGGETRRCGSSGKLGRLSTRGAGS